MYRTGPLEDSLHSLETGNPFEKCFDCQSRLEDCTDGYTIQKAFSKGETIIEIAVCHSCQEKLQSEYSTKSREDLWNFFLDRSDIPGRLEKFSPIPVGQIRPWINRCLTCEALLANTDEYTVAVQCLGDQIIYGESPFMVCGECIDSLFELLSEQTKGIYNEWLDRCLPMAPAQPEDAPRRKIMI